MSADWHKTAAQVEADGIEATKRRIATRRYEAETAGIDVQGIAITTGDRSKVLLSGKILRAKIAKEEGDTEWQARWKAPQGWVTLDAEQVIAIGVAVDDHVQACFDRESELLDALDAGELTDDMMEAGWPGQSS